MNALVRKGCCAAAIALLFASDTLGQTVVGPGETVSVASSSAGDFLLNGGTLAPSAVNLSGRIELQSASKIVRPQNNLKLDSRGNPFEESIGPTTISGSINGIGDFEIGNASRDQFFISGDNTHSGHTYFTAGQIFATSSTAFGSTAGGTTIQGGSLTVQAPTDEQFRVEGGSLSFRAGDFVPASALTIAGGAVSLPYRESHTTSVIVDSTGGRISFGFGANSSWTGGSSGVGNLEITGRIDVDAPLTHDGDLLISGVKLNTINSYTGKTTITGNYEIDRPDVFGTASSPIEIDEGEVTVNVLPERNRGFVVKRGTLDVQTTDPVNARIILGGGFSANIRGIGTFDGPIDYITSPGGGSATLSSGVFNGPIRGTTELGLGDVTLNAANEIDGRVRVRGGTVVVNHAEAITLAATQIESGTLELNVPATQSPFMTGPEFSGDDGKLRLNVGQQIDKTWTIYTGTVEPTADVSFQRLRLLGGNGPARIVSAEGGSTEIASELVAYGSSEIGGKVTGNGVIRTFIPTDGHTLNISGDLTEFTGDFRAERGRIVFGRSAGFTLPESLNPASQIHVFPNAIVEFHTGDIVIENDIFLHNAGGGNDFGGALRTQGNGSRTLAGRIDVGDQGSTIGDAFSITGEFTGTNLTLDGGSLGVASPQNNLRGSLRLIDGGITLYDAGEFHGLNEIFLQNGGRISLQPSADTDRIDDSTLIRSQGGFVNLNSSRDLRTTELLGRLHLQRGRTSVFASSDHGSLQATLAIDTLERDRGTVLHFDDAGPVTSTQITNTATFDGTMIGGWAVTDQEFASIDENDFIGTLQPTTSDLASATPQDHVRVVDNQSISDNLTIASCSMIPPEVPTPWT